MTDEEAYWLGVKVTSAILIVPLTVFIVKTIKKSNKEIKDIKDQAKAKERKYKQRDVDEEIDEIIEDTELRNYLNRNQKKEDR